MNNNILYHLANLDLRVILQEEVDQLIKTVDLPKEQVIELNNSEYLINIYTVKAPKLLEPKSKSDYKASYNGL
jgi:hypothetical protein